MKSEKRPDYIVKYSNGGNMKCKCGSEHMMFYARARYDFPYGFGGHGDGHFYVDKVRLSGWLADCPRGHLTLAYQSKKLVSKKLKGVTK